MASRSALLGGAPLLAALAVLAFAGASACDDEGGEPDAGRDAALPDGDADGSTDADGTPPADGDSDADDDVELDASSDASGDAEADDDADLDGGETVGADGDADDDVVVLPPWPAGRYITPEEVHLRLEASDPEMLLLNVVDEEFYDLGCIEGSLVIPWDLLEGRLSEVDPTRRVVIYCRRGVRSEAAYATLESHGYGHLWIMTGGIEAWTALGYPTVPVP